LGFQGYVPNENKLAVVIVVVFVVEKHRKKADYDDDHDNANEYVLDGFLVAVPQTERNFDNRYIAIFRIMFRLKCRLRGVDGAAAQRSQSVSVSKTG
jgi:hypothetical protein